MALTPNSELGVLIGDDSAELITLTPGQLVNFPLGGLTLGGNDTVFGSVDNEQINGNRDEDELAGGGGDDTLFGGQNNDVLDGQAGNDFLFGNLNADLIRGGQGDDNLFGGADNDILFGDFQNTVSNPIGLGFGFFSAFLIGLVACSWMIKLVKGKSLKYFAWYCLTAGLVGITLTLCK